MNPGLQIFRRKIVSMFKSANRHVSQTLETMPAMHEVGLDFVLLTHLQSLGRKTIKAPGGWSCTINAGFTGGKWHFAKREIGDILFALRYYKQSKFSYGKFVFLQSKRLNAARDKAYSSQYKFKYNFKRNSRYNELDLRASVNGVSTQYERIYHYEKIKGVRVFYLLYNPWQVPSSVVIPGPNNSSKFTAGARVIAARDIRKKLQNQTPSTFSRLMSVQNSSLETFVGELVLCQYGRRINNEDGFKEIHSSLMADSGAIWEVGLDVHMPPDENFQVEEEYQD